MALAFERAVQGMVYAALNGTVTGSVYDGAPELPDGMPAANFPFVDIGECTVASFDTDETQGAEVTVTLHFWSRLHGMNQINGLMGEARAALNRKALTASGYHIVDVQHEFSSTIKDPEGTLRHGVARYRVTIQEN